MSPILDTLAHLSALSFSLQAAWFAAAESNIKAEVESAQKYKKHLCLSWSKGSFTVDSATLANYKS